MAAVSANGISIEFDDTGTGEPLLLVMGLGAQLTDWPDGLVDAIVAHGFRVIRFDNRDSGLSTEFSSAPPTNRDLAMAAVMRRPLATEYLLTDMASDSVGLLDALGIESAHIVGASMGGMIAQTIAIEHPDRVRSLTSIMSTTGSRRVGRAKLRILARLARRPPTTRENAIDLSVEMFRGMSGPHFGEAEFRHVAEASMARSFRPDGTGRQLAAIIASGDRTKALRGLNVPTLVIHGGSDSLVDISGGRATAAAVRGSTLLEFDDMGHDLPEKYFAEIADAVASIAGLTSASIVNRRVRLRVADRVADLHPRWLRDMSEEPGQIDPTNRQRLFTPADIDPAISFYTCALTDGVLRVEFSDGHRATYPIDKLLKSLGWVADEEERPMPVAWDTPFEPFPYVDWSGLGWSVEEEDTAQVIDMIEKFSRHGFVILRDTPTEPGTVRRIGTRLGYLIPTNFGDIFDVRAEPLPADLAYTTVELLAHTDLPYRRPVPGIQMLHCLRNDSPGGDSTLVDGLAVATWLAKVDPEAHAALSNTEVVYRYDTGADTVVDSSPVFEYDAFGRFRRIRLNTKLDTPVVRDGQDLTAFYRGRRLLTERLNNHAHKVVFRLEPGDVMFMDNHRILHGRTEFDAGSGYRHLQGGYIEHDGVDTMHRLAVRRRRAKMSA